MNDQNTTIRPDSHMNQKSKRKSGFYFVRVGMYASLSVAEYNASYNRWLICGSTLHFGDDYFEEIDERPIVREEPKNE